MCEAELVLATQATLSHISLLVKLTMTIVPIEIQKNMVSVVSLAQSGTELSTSHTTNPLMMQILVVVKAMASLYIA